MTNLAEQSLGLDPGSPGPVTLQEKRQQYEDWFKSGRLTEHPGLMTHVRTDEGPGDPILAASREQAHTDSASKRLHELQPGYICRTDDEPGDKVDVSEDIRLKLAGVLASKMEGVDAETATRMANAGHALLAPLVRADEAAADKAAADKKAADDKAASDALVKNRVLNDKATDDNKEFILADVMTALGGFSKRLDAIESKGKDSEHTATPPKDKEDKKAADDAITDDAFRWRMKQDKLGTVTCSPDTQDAFAVVQSRGGQGLLRKRSAGGQTPLW